MLGVAALFPLWGMLHDYQRRRVLTLLDPTSDPLGAGYHISQSKIAIGSGGALSKIETTPLLTVEETLDALGRARSVGYRPPGA